MRDSASDVSKINNIGGNVKKALYVFALLVIVYSCGVDSKEIGAYELIAWGTADSMLFTRCYEYNPCNEDTVYKDEYPFIKKSSIMSSRSYSRSDFPARPYLAVLNCSDSGNIYIFYLWERIEEEEVIDQSIIEDTLEAGEEFLKYL